MKMGFECCHPAVNLIYFAAVLVGMIAFQHPAFLIISFLSAFVYSVKRNGWKAVVFNLCLLPFVTVYALYYSCYTHFGMTVLRQNFVGNNMTLESLVYGFVLGITGAGVCIWFSCVFSVFTTDKMVYLFGKVSPRLSLVLSILLRIIPRIKKEARRINMAQQGIGRGVNQGNVWQRLRNGIRIFSMLITWTIDSLTIASDSMGSRGSGLRGRKAFSIYRFDNRDRAYVIVMFLCLTLTAMGVMLKQTDMVYDPRIIRTQVNSVFCIGYGVFCLMPLGLELWTEYKFKKARCRL
jgi:energy-coupling factor transport system permease protein